VAVLHRRLRSGNEARLSPSDIAPLQRVLPKGCYPFLSGRSEKPFGLSWQAFRPQLRASIATANRSAFALSQSLTTPFADPFVGLKDRNLRDAKFYTVQRFSGQFFGVFFFKKVFYLVRREENIGFSANPRKKETFRAKKFCR
jgi:hypothetical protein